MTGGRGDDRRARDRWFADRTQEEWAIIAEARGEKVQILRAALRKIRGHRELDHINVMRVIEHICDEALGDE